jgi:hypothetical protein
MMTTSDNIPSYEDAEVESCMFGIFCMSKHFPCTPQHSLQRENLQEMQASTHESDALAFQCIHECLPVGTNNLGA